jgi:hypothetical protein
MGIAVAEDQGARPILLTPRIGKVSDTTINALVLQPYSTFLIVEYTGSDVRRAIPAMADLLKEGLRARGSRRSTLVASGLDDPQAVAVIGDEPDGIEVFVFRDTTAPSWTKESIYEDVEHHLVVIYARRHLLAVHAPRRLRSMAINRIRKSRSLLPFRLVSPRILSEAFLAGEAKGLWLHGVHPASTTKADAKNLSGQRLQDALDSFEDSTFTLRAGRAALADDPSRLALRGTVGTTPGDAVVWNRASDDFAGFILTAREALDLIHATSQATEPADSVFPQLARELDSLEGVHGAYEIVVGDPDFLPPGTSDEAREAAELLQASIIEVQGDPAGPNFTVSVGPNGAEVGQVRGRVVVDDNGTVVVDFGILGTSHHLALRPVLDALEHSAVYTVYYASGEVISGGSLTRRQTQHLPFHNWSFHDFDGYAITVEKPDARRPKPDEHEASSSQKIHDNIAREGDRSLFSWVVDHYSEGWLTCDDGPGEVADFVHLADDGTLRLIHVKAASSDADSRQVSVTNYEVVASQATKNLHFIRNPNALPTRLATPAIARPATWRDGQRIESRDEMIELLHCRSVRDRTRIVVVQPHQRRSVIDKLRVHADSGDINENVLRLQLLETLLTSARSTAVGAGADLEIIVSSA